MPSRFVILSPVLDDWPSYARLVADIAAMYTADDVLFEMVAVDDGSANTCDPATLPPLSADGCIESVSVVRLALNLGHQRAVAIGLVAVSGRDDIDGVIVMDSDGEDRPADLRTLIARSREVPGHIILARRSERSETAVFKLGYFAYKVMFRLAVGRGISFGNFCLLPQPAVRRLVHMSELWNNLPAAVIRSRIRHRAVQTRRGTRYAGRSKMNLPALIVHGLSALSVYTDVIFVRVLIAASSVCAFSVFSMVFIIFYKFATSLAIPGWASTMFGDVLIILIQTLVLIVATTLMLLSNRSARQIVPIVDTAAFVAEQRVVLRREPVQVMSGVA